MYNIHFSCKDFLYRTVFRPIKTKSQSIFLQMQTESMTNSGSIIIMSVCKKLILIFRTSWTETLDITVWYIDCYSNGSQHEICHNLNKEYQWNRYISVIYYKRRITALQTTKWVCVTKNVQVWIYAGILVSFSRTRDFRLRNCMWQHLHPWFVAWWHHWGAPPLLLCSSLCSPSSRPSACWVPALCAASVAVISIWAYLLELLPAHNRINN